MKKSLIGPPTVNKFQKLLGSSFLKLTRWEAVGNVPDIPKFVMIMAPHTSHWDLFYILAISYSLDIKFYWFGNKGFFRWPVGALFKWLGGIPVDRDMGQNIVQQTIEIIQSREQIIIALSPEGTRSYAEYWKTGFYYIANEAQIPIVFAFLDYSRKAGGLGPKMNPTGDIAEDMNIIRQFYSGITAKYPHNVGNISIKPRMSNVGLPQ